MKFMSPTKEQRHGNWVLAAALIPVIRRRGRLISEFKASLAFSGGKAA